MKGPSDFALHIDEANVGRPPHHQVVDVPPDSFLRYIDEANIRVRTFLQRRTGVFIYVAGEEKPVPRANTIRELVMFAKTLCAQCSTLYLRSS